jgi:hypothetical protein
MFNICHVLIPDSIYLVIKPICSNYFILSINSMLILYKNKQFDSPGSKIIISKLLKFMLTLFKMLLF